MTITPARCPHAASCWMGGGSYACVKTPPFCKEPLIPKEDDDSAAPVAVRPSPVRPTPPMTESVDEPNAVTIEFRPPPMKIKAVDYRFDWDGKDDAPSPVTPQKAVMIQGVLF